MAERAEGGGKSPERCMLQPGLHSEPLLGSGGPGLLRAWLLDSLLSENRGGPDSREKPVGGALCPWSWESHRTVPRLGIVVGCGSCTGAAGAGLDLGH